MKYNEMGLKEGAGVRARVRVRVGARVRLKEAVGVRLGQIRSDQIRSDQTCPIWAAPMSDMSLSLSRRILH